MFHGQPRLFNTLGGGAIDGRGAFKADEAAARIEGGHSGCPGASTEICHHLAGPGVGLDTNQRVVIYYNCIGAFDVPDRRKIPEADIIMETRKGVALSYAPEQVAV